MAQNLRAEDYIKKMVAHFCHLHYGAINLLFYGPFLAKLWHWQTSANLDRFRFVMAQNVRAEEYIKKILIIFCHLHYMALKKHVMAYLWPPLVFDGSKLAD